MRRRPTPRDNTEQIDELLAAYNAEHGWPGDSGGDGGEGGSDSSGCSCRTAPVAPFGVLLFGGLFLLGAGPRNSRPRRR